jgi:hypothetical protein
MHALATSYIAHCALGCAAGHKESDLTEADRHYLSDAYKREVVSAMSTSQLIEICLINPTVTLLPSYRCGAGGGVDVDDAGGGQQEAAGEALIPAMVADRYSTLCRCFFSWFSIWLATSYCQRSSDIGGTALVKECC